MASNTALKGAMDEMIRKAVRNNDDWIEGKALGPKPRFFVIADEPVLKDYLTQSPFSGKLQMVLPMLVQTLQQQHEDVTTEDLYLTYFVKTTFRKNELTAEMVEEEWLPILQMEYKLSGCELIVPLGELVKTYAGHIPNEPAIMKKYAPTFGQRVKNAWKALVA